MPKYSVLIDDAFYFLNQIRSNPREFAERLEELRGDFRGQTLVRREGVPIITREGIGAVNSAVDILKDSDSLPDLQWNEGLRRIAQELANHLSTADVDEINH